MTTVRGSDAGAMAEAGAMTWLSEDPWYLAGALGVAAACFLVALRATQDGRYLARAGIAGGLALAVLGVERAWVTDNERIEATIHDLASAVEAGDTARVGDLLADDVGLVLRGETLLGGGPGRREILGAVRDTRFDFVRVSRLEANAAQQSRRGTAVFEVTALGTFTGTAVDRPFGSVTSTWDLGLRETAPGVWKVNRITPTGTIAGAMRMSIVNRR